MAICSGIDQISCMKAAALPTLDESTCMYEQIGPMPNFMRCSCASESAFRKTTSPVVATIQQLSRLPFQLYCSG